MTKTRYPRQTKAYTNDQRLLMEIRDHLEALPLAKELKHQDVVAAKKLRLELDELREQLDYQKQVIRLLSRAAGIDPERLTEDEIGLLTETGALSGG